MQSRDNGYVAESDLRVVTKRAPSAQELADCRFAWTVAKHTKSNAIVYAKDGATAGIGAGDLAKAMLSSGFDQSVMIGALLGAGFPPGIVQSAAVAAGIQADVAASMIRNAGFIPGPPTAGFNNGKGAGPTGSGGGGKASGS